MCVKKDYLTESVLLFVLGPEDVGPSGSRRFLSTDAANTWGIYLIMIYEPQDSRSQDYLTCMYLLILRSSTPRKGHRSRTNRTGRRHSSCSFHAFYLFAGVWRKRPIAFSAFLQQGQNVNPYHAVTNLKRYTFKT